MREGAKRRLVGAVVIVALAVIFVPMLFEDDSLAPPEGQALLPDEPGLDDRFGADNSLPLPDQATESEPPDLPTETATLDLPPPESPQAPEPGFGGGQPGQIGRTETPSRTQSVPRPVPPTERTAAPPDRSPPARQASTPKKESAPPPPPPRTDGVPSWVVQVASLGSSGSANELAGKLKSAGFTAFVEKAEVRGKLYYRVRVGPEVDRDAAERAAARLRQQQKLDTLIQRYP